MDTTKLASISAITILFLGYLVVGLKGLLLFILGAITVIIVELWLFLRYVSRDPNEINGPLRVIHEYVPNLNLQIEQVQPEVNLQDSKSQGEFAECMCDIDQIGMKSKIKSSQKIDKVLLDQLEQYFMMMLKAQTNYGKELQNLAAPSKSILGKIKDKALFDDHSQILIVTEDFESMIPDIGWKHTRHIINKLGGQHEQGASVIQQVILNSLKVLRNSNFNKYNELKLREQAQNESLQNGYKALKELKQQATNLQERLNKIQVEYIQSTSDKIIDFEKTLNIEVKLKLAHRDLLDIIPKITDATFTYNEIKQSYLKHANEIKQMIIEIENNSTKQIISYFQQMSLNQSHQNNLVEILKNYKNTNELSKAITEEFKKNLSPQDIAVEPDSSPSSCQSLNENPDNDDEHFNLKEISPSIREGRNRKLSQDILSSVERVQPSDTLISPDKNLNKRQSQEVQVENPDDTLQLCTCMLRDSEQSFKISHDKHKREIKKLKQAIAFIQATLLETQEFNALQSKLIKDTLQTISLIKEGGFVLLIKEQWTINISRLSQEDRTISSFIKKLQILLQNCEAQLADQNLVITNLKQKHVESKELFTEKLSELKKQIALHQFIVKKQQSQVESSENQDSSKSSGFNMDDVKLFFENPISALKIAYNKKHPNEEEVKAQVLNALITIKEHLKSFKSQQKEITTLTYDQVINSHQSLDNTKNDFLQSLYNKSQATNLLLQKAVQSNINESQFKIPRSDVFEILSSHSDECQKLKDNFVLVSFDQLQFNPLIKELGKSNQKSTDPLTLFSTIDQKIDLAFVNKFIKICYQAWKTSPIFQDFILKELYISANKDNPEIISEVEVHKVVLHGQPPELVRIQKLDSDPKDFHYDAEISYRGVFEVLVKTEVALNLTENNTYVIPITCNVLVRSIHGRVRLFYSNDKPCWFGFVGKPAIKFNIDPVIGKNSQFEVKNFPKLRNFLEELIEKSFDKFCLPNTKPLNIPITIIEQVDWPPKYMKKDTCIQTD